MEQPFVEQTLDSRHSIYIGRLPAGIKFSATMFDELWEIHPNKFTEIMMHGRPVLTPRWQQAFGRDFSYSGQSNQALPIPSLLEPTMEWLKLLDPRFNGLLLNWYDGGCGHYIGKHRDSTKNLVPGSSIVTVSLGEIRCFRLRPHKGKGMIDLAVRDGDVVIMPLTTNQSWTHEIVKSSKSIGRRISITARAFIL